MASPATVSETVQADLDDASDASTDPRVAAAASGAPSIIDMFSLQDQSRAEHAVNELEHIETSAEAVEDDGVSDIIPTAPRLPPTPAQVRIHSEDRFDRHVYNAFIVCGATTRVAAFLSREVITMKGLTELAHGGGSNAEKWIAGVAKRLNTGESTVITPILTQRVCNLAWYCMDRVRRGITSLQDSEVTLSLLDDCAEHRRGEKRLKEGASAKKEPGKIKLDKNWREWKQSFYSYLRRQQFVVRGS